jgi:hypothetical protein
MDTFRQLASFAIAFIKDSFNAAKLPTVSVIQWNDETWAFPTLMVVCFLGALYLSIPPDRRSKLLRFQPRTTTIANHQKAASNRDLGETQVPHTPSPALPSLFGVEYKTPQPGPAFGHLLNKVPRVPKPTSRRFLSAPHTDPLPTPGHQTPTPKSRPTSSLSPDYAELSRSAPTNYATLQRMGMLDDAGTPTKKLLDNQQKQKFGVIVNSLSSVRRKNGKRAGHDPFMTEEE